MRKHTIILERIGDNGAQPERAVIECGPVLLPVKIGDRFDDPQWPGGGWIFREQKTECEGQEMSGTWPTL